MRGSRHIREHQVEQAHVQGMLSSHFCVDTTWFLVGLGLVDYFPGYVGPDSLQVTWTRSLISDLGRISEFLDPRRTTMTMHQEVNHGFFFVWSHGSSVWYNL
jgi:hypothetical protein